MANSLTLQPPPPRPSAVPQWFALTQHQVRASIASRELLFAVLIPIIFTLGFYLPLRYVMSFVQGLSYDQYVVAIVVLQTASFTMIAGANRSAVAQKSGYISRLQTMPVSALAPFAARLTVGIVRALVSVSAAVAFGYVIGFRLHGGWLQSLGFFGFALAVNIVLIVASDFLGLMSKDLGKTSTLLALPTLILGMMSTGFLPEGGFPEWIRPFVRNQPVSHFAATLRGLATEGASWSHVLPSFLWLGGMLVIFIPLALWAAGRRE